MVARMKNQDGGSTRDGEAELMSGGLMDPSGLMGVYD